MKKLNRKFITIIASALLFCTVTASAGALGRNKSKYQYSVPQGIDLSGLDLEDGVYTGSATGFGPDLTVEVTVENGSVTGVDIISHNEVGPQYYRRAIRCIPDELIDEQSTDIDAVSGATATSCGIISAVENALGL